MTVLAPSGSRSRRLISVCIPARNCAPFLPEAIDSVLAEDVGELEVVVFDDASTDDTTRVVGAFDPHVVRYFRHRRQVGIPANRNSCLAMARGRYIAWLDADDRLLPGGLARLVGAVEVNPQVGLAHGAFEVMAEDGRRLPDWPMPFETDVVEASGHAFRELVLLNYITAPVLVRRECHDRAGGYATDIGPSSTDWEMWLRIALQTDLAFVAQPLSRYRQHAGSITSATHRDGRRLECDAAAVTRVLTTCRPQIAEADALESAAHAALLAKALLLARDAVARSAWVAAESVVARHLPGGGLSEERARTLRDVLAEHDEYGFHEESRAALADLRHRLAGTRLAKRLEKVSTPDPTWARTLETIAATVKDLVPANACIAAVDKWDPTLLRLAGRAGRHFPDRRVLPDGYPADSQAAVAHLELLRREGATHLLVPEAAFWWLTYYDEFARHLERCYVAMWRDQHCVIYGLTEGAA